MTHTFEFTYEDSANGVDFERTLEVRFIVSENGVHVLSAIDKEYREKARNAGLNDDGCRLGDISYADFDRMVRECWDHYSPR